MKRQFSCALNLVRGRKWLLWQAEWIFFFIYGLSHFFSPISLKTLEADFLNFLFWRLFNKQKCAYNWLCDFHFPFNMKPPPFLLLPVCSPRGCSGRHTVLYQIDSWMIDFCCCCLVTKSCLTLVTPWTVANQAPLSIQFPRQEYWSGLPFPSPGDLPDPGGKPASPAMAGGFFTAEPPGKPSLYYIQPVEASFWCGSLVPNRKLNKWVLDFRFSSASGLGQ